MVLSATYHEVSSAAEDAARWNDANRLRLLLAAHLESSAVLGCALGCKDVPHADSWRPALATAIANNSLDALIVLIDAIGVDTCVDVATGWTGLHIAAFLNAELVAQLFVAKGANMGLKSSMGQTPVEVATIHGNNEVLSVLANPDIVFAKSCTCGTEFLEDSLFCRRCGLKRPVDISFDPTIATETNPKRHIALPQMAVSSIEIGIQSGAAFGEFDELAIQTDAPTPQVEVFTQCVAPPTLVDTSSQCVPYPQVEAFAQCTPPPVQVEACTQSLAPPALVEAFSQCVGVVSADFASQCSLPAPGVSIGSQTLPPEQANVSIQFAPEQKSLYAQTMDPSLSNVGTQCETDTSNNGAQTDSISSHNKASQYDIYQQLFARSCQTDDVKREQASIQCGVPSDCYRDVEMQAESISVCSVSAQVDISTEDASMQVFLGPDVADFGVQMDRPSYSDSSTQCIALSFKEAEVQVEVHVGDILPSPSPSMVQTVNESLPIPAIISAARQQKPNKSWDGSPKPSKSVSLNAVGVGREIVWRFRDEGAVVHGFKHHEPVQNLRIGDILVKINDTIIEGLPKDQVMSLWKTQKGMSESTTFVFRREVEPMLDEVENSTL